MIPALTAQAMRDLDERACAAESATILMRRAGIALASQATRMLGAGRVIGIAGPGNNGGDAFAACASLDARYERIVLELEHGAESAARSDARDRAINSGVAIRSVSADALAGELHSADLILDGILGVGSRFPLSPALQTCIDAINAATCPVLAIDIPSGIDADTGAVPSRAVLAQTTLPSVVDASGLFHLSKHLDALHGKPLVVTPHGDEFSRLSGEGTVRPGTRVARVRAFVERTGITTLLKGRDTIVDDGISCYINPTGTNALATAGSGDVLTGIIAALIARGGTPATAACIGAYWHGLAGQICGRQRHIGTIASDLPEALGDALELAATRAQPSPGGTLIATA